MSEVLHPEKLNSWKSRAACPSAPQLAMPMNESNISVCVTCVYLLAKWSTVLPVLLVRMLIEDGVLRLLIGSSSSADDKLHFPDLMPSAQLTLLFIGPSLAAGLEAQAGRLEDRVLLHVALDVVLLLLLLLLLLFVRACRRGVAFFFLSNVMSCHDALNITQQYSTMIFGKQRMQKAVTMRLL